MPHYFFLGHEYHVLFLDSHPRLVIPADVVEYRGPESEWAPQDAEQERFVLKMLHDAGISHRLVGPCCWEFPDRATFETFFTLIRDHYRNEMTKHLAADPNYLQKHFPGADRLGQPFSRPDRDRILLEIKNGTRLSQAEVEPLLQEHALFVAAPIGPNDRWKIRDTNAAVSVTFFGEPTRAGRQLKLSGFRLEDLSFSGRELRWGNLSRAFFENADFSEADLTAIAAIDAEFADCRFYGTRLDSALLARSRFVRCSFEAATLSGANCENAEFFDCDFSGALLEAAHFTPGFAGAFFKDARLA